MTATVDTPAGTFEVAELLTFGEPEQTTTDPRTWTLAYRKRTGPVFHRVTNWAGTWEQAHYLAGEFATEHPELQVWYTPSLAHEQYQAAELPARVARGEISQELADTYLEDHGNILMGGHHKRGGAWTEGKRVKVRDNGTLSEQLLARVMSVQDAQIRWQDGAV